MMMIFVFVRLVADVIKKARMTVPWVVLLVMPSLNVLANKTPQFLNRLQVLDQDKLNSVYSSCLKSPMGPKNLQGFRVVTIPLTSLVTHLFCTDFDPNVMFNMPCKNPSEIRSCFSLYKSRISSDETREEWLQIIATQLNELNQIGVHTEKSKQRALELLDDWKKATENKSPTAAKQFLYKLFSANDGLEFKRTYFPQGNSTSDLTPNLESRNKAQP